MKIRPVEADVFHVGRRTDGRIDKMELIAAFCNFVNVAEQHLRRFTEKNGNIKTEQYSLCAIL